MAKIFDQLSKAHQEFILKQKIFFVGTAAESGTVNVSPKGLTSLIIENANSIIWHNLTGSGNETAAHLLKNNRMTLMFCAFEGAPLILRVYGQAKIHHRDDDFYKAHIDKFPPSIGSRQIISIDIDRVQTSCGSAVPLMQFSEERQALHQWNERKGEDGISEYWKEKNQESIDGFPTGIPISRES